MAPLSRIVVVVEPLSEDIFFFDKRTERGDGAAVAGMFGLAGAVIVGLASEGDPQAEMINSFRFLSDSLREFEAAYVIDSMLHERLDIERELVWATPEDDSAVDAARRDWRGQKTGEKDYRLIARKYDADAVLHLQYLYGLALDEEAYHPSVAIESRVELTSSDGSILAHGKLNTYEDYRISYSIEAFCADSGAAYRSQVQVVSYIYTKQIASVFGVDLPSVYEVF